MMTRKDYVKIAAALYDAGILQSELREVVRELCKVFKEDNELFDEDRFYAACGLDD